MTGGDDRDVFQFRIASDFNATRGSADVITDFDQSLNERIQLNAVDANINTGTNDDFEWISSNAFSGTAGEMRYQQAGGDTFIEGDTNGDGIADIMIRLTGLYTLDATDIVGASDLQPNVTGGELQSWSYPPDMIEDMLTSDAGRISFENLDGQEISLPQDPAAAGESKLSPNTFDHGEDALLIAPAMSSEDKPDSGTGYLDPVQLQNSPMPVQIMLPADELI